MGQDHRATTTKTAVQKQTPLKPIKSMTDNKSNGTHPATKLTNKSVTKISGVKQDSYGKH